MPFPYFIRKLFQNDGAGDKLKPEVIPTTVNGVAADELGNIAIKETDIPHGPFLPLAGGDMQGWFSMRAGDKIYGGKGNSPNTTRAGFCVANDDNSCCVEIAGGTTGAFDAKAGAALYLAGKDHGKENTHGQMINSGTFLLESCDGTTVRYLQGFPDGRLIWGDQNVHCVASFNDNGEQWARKYSDGWIEQGGCRYVNFLNLVTVNHLIPFEHRCCYINAMYLLQRSGYIPRVTSSGNSSFVLGQDHWVLEGINEGNVTWFACGY